MVHLCQGTTPGNQGLQEVVRSIPQLFRSGLGFPESNGPTELRILWVPSYTPYADCRDVEMFSCV